MNFFIRNIDTFNEHKCSHNLCCWLHFTLICSRSLNINLSKKNVPSFHYLLKCAIPNSQIAVFDIKRSFSEIF